MKFKRKGFNDFMERSIRIFKVLLANISFFMVAIFTGGIFLNTAPPGFISESMWLAIISLLWLSILTSITGILCFRFFQITYWELILGIVFAIYVEFVSIKWWGIDKYLPLELAIIFGFSYWSYIGVLGLKSKANDNDELDNK